MAVRRRPVPRLPPLEQSGGGPSTLISPASNAQASPRLTPCHWKPSSNNCVMIESPGRRQAVAVVVEAEGGEVVVVAPVFPAILLVREAVDEIVAAVIAPGRRPLAGAAGVVVGVLATATIAAFEIACRVDDETGVANSVTHGLCCHAHHFADGRHACRSKFDVGQAHLRDEPLRVDQSEPPLRIVGRGEVGPRRPLSGGAAAAAGKMAGAAA